ncbi:MAG: PCRF domain-containing protein, partial [Oscillospiraceae bacterium]
MFEKLNFVEEKYEDINNKLMDPTVISDNKQYKNLMKEYKNLTPIVEKYREYIAVKKDFDEAKSMLDEGGLDKDFKEMVVSEYEDAKEKIETFTEELKILLLPKDPNDDKNVIVEIRGGAGGQQEALNANSLTRKKSKNAEAQRRTEDVNKLNATEL